MSQKKLARRNRAVIVSAGVVLATASAITVPALAAATSSGSDSTYIVLYRDGASSASAASTVGAAGGTVVANYSQIGVVIARSSNASFAAAVSSNANVSGAASTRGFATQVRDLTAGGTDPAAAPAPTLGDSLSGLQWDMTQIHVAQAQAINAGSPAVTVGDIDTGLDYTHPDLAANVDFSKSASCVSGAPDTSPAAWMDDNGHGTHTAGTIAAAKNGIGIVGVAPNVNFNAVPRPRTAEEFRERFDVLVTTSYGSSECGTSFADASTDPVYRSFGRPRPGLGVRLVDPEDKDVEPGLPGELLLRPAYRSEFTPEYVNNPEASAQLERDGWFPTGDLLRCDEEGRYYYVDRLRDSIRRRGENISSVEVELAVGSHDGVLECAAIGVGDPADQEVMIVVIRAEGEPVSEEQLLAHAADRLPYYAVPRFVAFVDTLPRTPTGKIQKVALRSSDLERWDREEAGFVVARPARKA